MLSFHLAYCVCVWQRSFPIEEQFNDQFFNNGSAAKEVSIFFVRRLSDLHGCGKEVCVYVCVCACVYCNLDTVL